MLFVDVDRFKTVNDTFGHAAGEAVLREVAQRLRHCVRPADTVGRLSGDEFVLVCTARDAAEVASEVTRRIRRAMARTVVVSEARHIHVTVSIGLQVSAEGEPDAILQAADRAMFAAKQHHTPRLDGVPAGGVHHIPPVAPHRSAGRLPVFSGALSRLLRLLQLQAGADVVWTSCWQAEGLVVQHVERGPSAPPLGLQPGVVLPASQDPWPASLGDADLHLVVDLRTDPGAARLSGALEMPIGSYLEVVLRSPKGEAYGVLTAARHRGATPLTERDVTAARLVAEVIATLGA